MALPEINVTSKSIILSSVRLLIGGAKARTVLETVFWVGYKQRLEEELRHQLAEIQSRRDTGFEILMNEAPDCRIDTAEKNAEDAKGDR